MMSYRVLLRLHGAAPGFPAALLAPLLIIVLSNRTVDTDRQHMLLHVLFGAGLLLPAFLALAAFFPLAPIIAEGPGVIIEVLHLLAFLIALESIYMLMPALVNAATTPIYTAIRNHLMTVTSVNGEIVSFDAFRRSLTAIVRLQANHPLMVITGFNHTLIAHEGLRTFLAGIFGGNAPLTIFVDGLFDLLEQNNALIVLLMSLYGVCPVINALMSTSPFPRTITPP